MSLYSVELLVILWVVSKQALWMFPLGLFAFGVFSRWSFWVLGAWLFSSESSYVYFAVICSVIIRSVMYHVNKPFGCFLLGYLLLGYFLDGLSGSWGLGCSLVNHLMFILL
jgi:hypothetical protein